MFKLIETAFEGNRFTDLVRIAEHKTDGIEWLAKKIANYSTMDDLKSLAKSLLYLSMNLSQENNPSLPTGISLIK